MWPGDGLGEEVGLKRALLIDLGNVLVRYDHDLTVDRIVRAAGEADPVRVRSALFGSAERDFDLGRLTPSSFFREVETRASLRPIPDEVWIPAWRDIFEPIPESIGLLSLLRSGIRTVLVSNTNALHWQGVMAVSDVDKRVDSLALSFQVGIVKPDPRLFRHALRLAGADPGEALFADDRPAFVEAARTLGIDAIEVASPRHLREGLLLQGLLRDGPASPAPPP